ncbi:MAG: ABC-type transport auxiliary lipoprotein family protein [Burkholderiaceae bacterium]
MNRLLSLAALAALALLAGCISVAVGNEGAAHRQYQLIDAGASDVARRAEPLLAALLIQLQPGDAMADTASMAYSPRANEFAFYQFATWTERPVRQLPRLLQRRLEARGTAAAVGLIGEPLRAQWLLNLAIVSLHHDVSSPPGSARFVLNAELFDRRSRARLAQRQFEVQVPSARADSAAAAEAMSRAVGRSFDALVPWLESELQRVPAAAR